MGRAPRRSLGGHPTREPSVLEVVRSAPAVVLQGAVVIALVVLGADRAGYPVTAWAPTGLIAVLALVLAGALVATDPEEVPRAAWWALGALAAYAAWSLASVAWAADRGAALEGAGRTLLYLVIYALFVLWRGRARAAAALLGGWTLLLAAVAVVTLLSAAAAHDPHYAFVDGRLADPAGYPNADAATWLEALWPALALATPRRMPWWLRGLFAAAAVLLAGVALLSQSRGSLIAVPVVLVGYLALVPGRARTLGVLVPVAAAVGVSAPVLLGVFDHLSAGGSDASGALASAARVLVGAAALAGLVVAGWGAVEQFRPVGPETAERLRRGVGRAGAGAAAVAVVAVVAVAGNPVTRVRDAWDSFRGGHAEVSGPGRLAGGLGSNRYDFYRVALDELAAHPLNGVGADNFSEDYLVHGRSGETPRYPHSVEFRALAQTGLIGALALGAFVVGALALALRGVRRREPLARAVAAGAAGAAVYWLVHGSADWFWEFGGLGAPAMAWLGLAGALAPRREESFLGRRALLAAPSRAAIAGVAVVTAVLVLGALWWSAADADRALSTWRSDPGRALALLDRAASIDPYTDQPYLLSGTIALRLNSLPRADHDFALALERNPRGAYAALERGAIASQAGRRAVALALLSRAVAEDPRDALAREALAVARSGRRIDVGALNQSILAKAAQIQHP